MLALIGDLYAASAENQTFLHARFDIGDDPLTVYKASISRWVYPDVFERQGVLVAKAKKAIADYRKAIGKPAGLAELMTYYCEQASTFAADVAMDDGGFYDALVKMFESALKTVGALDATARRPFLERLEAVRVRGHRFGYCVGDEMDDLWGRWV